jgi:nucleoside phosphorylase
VLIAETIAPYDLAKVGELGDTLRGQPLACGVTLRDRFVSGAEGWTFPASGRRLRVHTGLVLSGEKVIDRKEFRDHLLSHYPTAIGGEMEGSGVYAAAARSGTEVILVKAVCDFADGHKNDRGQPFAARAAVAFVERVLAKPDALDHLGARDRGLPRGKRV